MKSLKEVEKEHIAAVLDACDWNKKKSAKVLGINRTTLYNKIKRYDISKKVKGRETPNNGRMGSD